MFRALGRDNQLLMLALFVWGLGEGLWYINFRQPCLVELGATEAQVGLALAIEMGVRALLPIPAGYLADCIGSHRVMVASWFVGLVGTVICALATTWQAFIPGLVIYAISGFAMPSLSAYAIQVAPDRTRPGAADRVLTTVFAAYTAGLIVSPALGGTGVAPSDVIRERVVDAPRSTCGTSTAYASRSAAPASSTCATASRTSGLRASAASTSASSAGSRYSVHQSAGSAASGAPAAATSVGITSTKRSGSPWSGRR